MNKEREYQATGTKQCQGQHKGKNNMKYPQPCNMCGDGPRPRQMTIEEAFGSKKAVTKAPHIGRELTIVQWNAQSLSYDKGMEFGHERYADVDVILIQELGHRLPRIPGFRTAATSTSYTGLGIFV